MIYNNVSIMLVLKSTSPIQ